MEDMKKSLLLSLFMLFVCKGYCQIEVRGRVVNERGIAVEYASVWLENDSVGAISDIDGNFVIKVPKGSKNSLTFSHVSYQKAAVGYQTYSSGNELTVVLKDKVVELADVVIDKGRKPKNIMGRGVTALADAGMRGKGRENGIEWGPVLKNKKDMVVSDILLSIKKCTYKECTLSINIYKVNGRKFVNILNKPLYHKVTQDSGRKQLHIVPEETIVLKGKTKYYITVSVVDSDAWGMIYFPSAFRTCYARRIETGKLKKLPVGPAIIVKGMEI